ncbi:MAG: soxC [Betaproteobacteria bacterium]|nr:soxC [Betaproteobacteria bacterium]
MPVKPVTVPDVIVNERGASNTVAVSVATRVDAALGSASRRNFLRRGTTIAGGALAAGATAGSLAALPVPDSNKGFGKPIAEDDYGMPSKFESKVRRRRTDIFKNRQNFSDWSMTPLQSQYGIVTPNGLIYERHHNGTPDIDPAKHRLVIHGMVRQPLEFTMEDLMRYPAVSKFYFMECSGNGLTDWLKPASNTVQQTHGLLSGGQWTGVPVSWLLDEAGLQPAASWAIFEGADGSAHLRSLPMKKLLDDCLLVYALNGEMLRPENGYPLRLFVPGWEGNVSVKWLRRIKVGDQPWHVRGETARYTDPMPDGKWRQFSFDMECKSVITRPSGGMNIKPGMHEIQGLAWSGKGKIKAIDVTTDGGKNWQEAVLEEPVMDKCLTAFRFRWDWKGGPATIASRAVDSTGYVQPTVADIQKSRAIVGFVQHHNGVFPWSVSASGEVKNAIA